MLTVTAALFEPTEVLAVVMQVAAFFKPHRQRLAARGASRLRGWAAKSTVGRINSLAYPICHNFPFHLRLK
jgi:hypothetical protein